MNIEWINHASFLLEIDDLKLVSDPWMEGRVFNRSWELLAEIILDIFLRYKKRFEVVRTRE